MKFKNAESETNFNKGFDAQKGEAYGERCFTYARDWADLMEAEISAGNSIAECAEKTSHMADTDGITGYMYGVACSILAQCWEHGEVLRIWHNGQYGAPVDTKGTVNPAILTISTP